MPTHLGRLYVVNTEVIPVQKPWFWQGHTTLLGRFRGPPKALVIRAAHYVYATTTTCTDSEGKQLLFTLEAMAV
jgi:hypothetical protein